MHVPRFSIVIPAYNDEMTLSAAVESVVGQGYDDYEVILVDDGSSDGSLSVMDGLAKENERISVIVHKENKGSFQARKTGVLHTRGSYVLFLDGDDLLSPGALKRLDSLLNDQPADILHFSMEVIPSGDVSKEQARGHAMWLMPYRGLLTDEEVLAGCLLDELYPWNLCGKLFEGELCRKAFSLFGDLRASRGEDLVAYLMCAFFARSYRGLPDDYLYVYSYGSGGDGQATISLDRFEREWFHYPALVKEFDAFLKGRSIDARVHRIYLEKLKTILLRDTVDTLAVFLSRNAAGRVLDKLMSLWDPVDLVPLIACKDWEDQARIAVDAADAALFSHRKITPRRIGVYYAEVQSLRERDALMRILQAWRTIGCEVFLFTDQLPPDGLRSGFEGVPIYAIQPKYPLAPTTEKLRFDALHSLCEENNVDTLVYGQWLSHALIWDLVFLKAKGVAVIAHVSEDTARPLRGLRSYFSTQPHVLALCDALTFDDDPARCLMPASCVSRPQLLGARIVAMIFRKTCSILPTAVARKLVHLAHTSCEELVFPLE